jgi:hypothetical protein
VRRLVRSADQLDIVVELIDADVVDDVVTPTGPGAAMRLTFGSQHTVERTFTGPAPTPPTNGVNHIAAGDSVVVVPIAAAFPFTVDGVLDAAERTAGLAGQATEGTPDGSVTAVEAPTGLWLSPVAPARLVAAREPITTGDTTEVWTGRLEPTTGPAPLDVAAIDHIDDALLVTQRPNLEARGDIVKNSTTPDTPLSARRLWLSSAGAFADLHGEWAVGVGLYDHLIAAGRDVRVEFQSLGYLLPFGHRAAIADVSERVVLDDEGGGQTAVMQSTLFLVVVDPVVTTPRAGARLDGHGLPFARLTASASGTTPVRLVAVPDGNGAIAGVHDLRVVATGADLMVDYLAVDRGGNDVSFSLPATFIDDEVAYRTGPDDPPAAAIAAAATEGRGARRVVDLGGQRVTYADPFAAGQQPARATHRFALAWDAADAASSEADLTAARSPAVFGVLDSATVVHEMAGSATGATGETVDVTHHQRWLDHGNDVAGGNFDLAFLKLGHTVSSLIGGGSAVGGVAQFELQADVFNQSAGAGLDLDVADPTWPDELLGDASRIIGNILLSEVIDLVEEAIPGLTVPGTTISEDGLTVEFTYCPTLHDLPEVGFRTTDQTRCCVHITTTASIDDGIEAGFETEMRVENFFLDFPPIIQPPVVVADFASIVGTISSDGSTSIVPTVRSWDFSGTISMLMALVDKLGLGNVDLKILGDLIDIDSSINLPDIALGVAEIKNFAINLGFELPLGPGDGQLSIGIGSKSSPLDIDVLMFGATFWLDIDLGFNGGLAPPTSTTSMGLSVYWEMLDFDIIVVSISFTLRLSADWKLSGGEVVFTGAVSLEGEIDVLGLISVSAALIASLRYESATEQMVLKGTITYCVDSFLGKLTSGTVPIGETEIELGDGQSTARRALGFPAAGGRSSFSDRYSEDAWDDYCLAFA